MWKLLKSNHKNYKMTLSPSQIQAIAASYTA